jgi:carbonic anhydrase
MTMDVTRILEANAAWAIEQSRADPEFFTRLTEGQRPATLYIGCSDSRVTAEDMMGVGPGEVFVLRNIANMVSALDVGSLSVVAYAVTHLEVSDIVVCGHYLCGGIEAAMQPRDLGMLNHWLRTIRDIYRLHSEELDAISDRDARLRRLVELNVREQCINVLKTAEVQRAYRAGRLGIHGWVFDISQGRLIDLGIDVAAEVAKIAAIYRLDP